MAFKKGKGYGQRNPGRMIKAMAMFEVFYAQNLWSAKKHIEIYKANNYEDKKISLYSKEKDEKKNSIFVWYEQGEKRHARSSRHEYGNTNKRSNQKLLGTW